MTPLQMIAEFERGCVNAGPQSGNGSDPATCSECTRGLIDALSNTLRAPMDASAPQGLKCADCSLNAEPCATCYTAWWYKRYPNFVKVEVNSSLNDAAAIYAYGQLTPEEREILRPGCATTKKTTVLEKALDIADKFKEAVRSIQDRV